MSLSFPASPTIGDIYAQNGRSFRWSGYAWELVSNVVSHAASHGSGGADQVTIAASSVTGLATVATSGSYTDLSSKPTIPAATTSASDLSAGTLADARLSANVVLTGDSRLSNSRAPTAHAASHATGGTDAITAGIIGAAAASHTHSAADVASGSLADARLSANVILAAALAARQHQTTAALDVIDRGQVGTAIAAVTGATYWTFFTPAQTMTITQIAMASSGAASGITLCRFGLYTMDASGTGTLAARTLSDTTIFAVASTIYTRTLDTTGGYPAAYTLLAGVRYASAMCLAASNTGSTVAASANAVAAAVSPRVQGVRVGANDLLTTQGSWQYNGVVGHAYWARLS